MARAGLAPSTTDSLSVTVSADPSETTLGDWDDLVRSCPLADVAQLSAWTRVRKLAGYDRIYVFVFDRGRLVGGAQTMVRRIRLLGALGYVPYGPVVSQTTEDPDAVYDTIAHALAQLSRHRFHMLAVQPPEGADRASAALLARGFRDSDADVAPAASLRVDLSLDEAQLRRNLSKRLRTWTNSWEERGVTVRRGYEEDLPLLAELLAETAEHQGFTPFDIEYLRTMYRELAPAGHLVVFVGEVARRPIAMTVFTACGTVLKVRLLGLDRSDEGRRLNVPAAVYWTAMKWARDNGYQWFDFGGVLPTSVPALLSGRRADLDGLSGPDRYKARFGGRVFRHPQPVELIPSRIVRTGYDLVRRSAAGRQFVAWVKRRSRAGDRARSRSINRMVRSSIAARGRITVIGILFEKVVKPPYVKARQFGTNVLFDRRYHVDTSGVISCAELGLSDPRFVWYGPAGVTRLRRILPPREVSEEDVFIDFGSGKGRAVLQAALHYPFRRVYGVELSEQLHEIAERNVASCQDRLRCRDVRLIRANATDFEIPDDVTVAFFNNPFVGEVFETVIARLLTSVDRHPRRVRIVYGNPVEEAALLRTGRVRTVRTLRGWRPGREWARSNSFRLYEMT